MSSLLCHHLLSVMMTRNYCTRKYNKHIFAVSRFNFSLNDNFFTLIFVGCIITVLSGRLEWCQDWCHSITQPRKPPITQKDLRDLLYMLSYCLFCLMVTGIDHRRRRLQRKDRSHCCLQLDLRVADFRRLAVMDEIPPWSAIVDMPWAPVIDVALPWGLAAVDVDIPWAPLVCDATGSSVLKCTVLAYTCSKNTPAITYKMMQK